MTTVQLTLLSLLVAYLASGCASDSFEPPCGLTLSPDLEALDATVSAAERWSAATGCPVAVAEGAIPVRVVDQARDLDGRPIRGGTMHRGDAVVQIDVSREGPAARKQIVLHELGHALRAAMGHSTSGLMADSSKADRIDAESLAFVCERHGCQAFNPEN